MSKKSEKTKGLVAELTAVELKAIDALLPSGVAKKASESLMKGDHDVDFTIRIKGYLRKGEDFPEREVAAAKPWLLLAVAFSHLNGVTVESITKEALTADPALVDSIKAQAAKAIEALKAPTEKVRPGVVTCELSVEKL